MQALARRVGQGGALTCTGVTASAQPFLAALLQQLFPRRPIVLVTENLKTQESFHQDLETWAQVAAGGALGLGEHPSTFAKATADKPSNIQHPTSIGGQGPTSDLRPIFPLPSPIFHLLFYPAWEILPHEGKLPHADVISERLQTLVALSPRSTFNPQPSTLVVTSVTALLQKTFAPDDLSGRSRRLQRGDTIAPLDLIEFLEAQGYEPEAQVSQKGELALRGGILDVFPPTSPWPVRLEFFGDELESLRHFEPLTQISRTEISEVTIPPAGEIGMLRKQGVESGARTGGEEGRGKREDRKEDGGPRANIQHSTSNAQHPTSNIQRPLIQEGDRGQNAEGGAQLGTLLDHLPRETIFILCDPEALASQAENYAQLIPGDDPFHITWQAFLAELQRRGLTSLALEEDAEVPVAGVFGAELNSDDPQRLRTPEGDARGIPRLTGGTPVPLFGSLDAFRPLAERAPEPQIAEAQRREFLQQLQRWLRQDYAVHVFCNNEGERQRFEEIWNEMGMGTAAPSTLNPQPSTNPAAPAQPQIHLGSLARGFICDEARFVVITDAEIFGRYKIQRPRKLKSPHALAARSALDIDFTDLEEGDLVVHLQHGIGRYLGLKNLPATAGNSKSEIECLVIEYAPAEYANEPPKLYVPVSESHLVSKYVGAGKAHPPLNTLGGTRWAKAKEQTEKAVRDVAAELLRIQAVRETQAGHPCQPDTQWQREFESAFIYEETPDQLRAIAETKADQERAKPMDRLICGDVGFGKTEVAIRAAFKCVMDGKQVAILVPTTVLAQQHYNNFRERMADYPVRLELLSRFRTQREQKQVLQALAAGAVDIVIGTHRIVQDDIGFKDLGLVVIDEEQRFGVLHKEKFKRLRTLVDVLTLSATPIPRTLYLALTGARDMSTIQTPPHDRLPVETIATAYDERLIRDAIQRELQRGGQVFFLHNRVTTIETMRAKLQTLVPQARIVVGHGQMHADDLEEVMTAFVNGQADVLLSTTIIESGLDIPNANTIIIDRADRFGLSELYQLRGRVGRYKHQAYAYLLLPRHARLLTDVRKRISAMKQYATLGSGFKIAMRDLEIRGAGNLLGAEQSGHITAVGFELYCQLLKHSVGALKGEKVQPRGAIRVALDFLETENVQREADASRVTHHASLPHNYVPEPHHRIELYRKLAQATEKPLLEALRTEMRDRFGPLPAAVELLLAVAELKILAGSKNVTSIEVVDNKLQLVRAGDFITLGGKFPRLTKKEPMPRLKEIKRLLLAL